MSIQSEVNIRDLSIGFGAVKVLEKLNLKIAPSEFLVLLGPSGCGKSTLLNAIAGLIDVQDGEIRIGDRNVTWEEPKDRGIAMVFQSYALYPRMTVRKNMSFGLQVAGTPQAEIELRVAEAAKMLRLQD
ncbi:MAG: ATP-binding cassette domain-containing protein, partial [Beijerinckiaceae bacterium]